MILEETPAIAEPERPPAIEAPEERSPEQLPAPPELPVVPFLVSAKSRAALLAQAGRLRSLLGKHAELLPIDVAFSLATTRAHFDHRAAVIGSDRDELLAGVDALARGNVADGLLEGVAVRGGKVAFVFPGQGCQWVGMGVDLLESSPVFARRMRACSEALARHVDWSLEEVLRGADGAPSLERVDVVQPALFAVMVSLAELWRSYGVKPNLVIGHSQGEIAAAAVAGALSLDDAAAVSALRSKALAGLAGKGGMVSVSVSRAEVEELLRELEGEVSLAAVNGPASMVLSGSPDALGKLLVDCEKREVRAQSIAVDYASHSTQIEAVREELLGILASIAPTHSEMPVLFDADRGADRNYRAWRRVLVSQPTRAGALRGRNPRCDRARQQGLHRGKPSPGAGNGAFGDDRRGRHPARLDLGRRFAAPRRGQPQALHPLTC